MARKGILFDLDGNLVKSRIINEKVAKKEGEILFENRFPMNSKEEISNKWIEISNNNPYLDNYHEIIVRDILGKPSPFYENLAREIQLHYEKVYFSDSSNWTGNIPEVLNNFKSKYKIGILTNGVIDKQKRKLNYIPDITNLCDEIHITPKEYAKPGIYGFYHLCDVLGIEPKDLVMVGDKISADVFGGNRVGMETVWFQRGDHKNKDSSYFIKNPTDLMKTYGQKLLEYLTPNHTIKNFKELELIF